MRRTIWMVLTAGIMVQPVASQSQGPKWQRSAASRPELQLFHSQHAFNLPTAEMLRKGEMEFEISHRFLPTVKEGMEYFYGLDGPVNMRFALSYALTNRWQLALGRGNVTDQIDLQVKHKAVQLLSGALPVLAGVQAGAAWNSRVPGRDNGDPNNFQFYGQLIFNTVYAKKLGLGLTPTYLYNKDIYAADRQDAVTLGSYVQYWLGPSFSLCTEWIPIVSGKRYSHNTFSFGMEMETGGHFFKIVVTNNTSLNSAQVHAGADSRAGADSWRLGFMITRLLKI